MSPSLSDSHDVLTALLRVGSTRVRSEVGALRALLHVGWAFPDWVRRELAACAHTEPGFRVLHYLNERGTSAVGTRDLARALRLSPAVMNGVLGRLEVSGLIAQQRCATDREAFAIVVTPSGRAAYSAARDQLARAVGAVMGGFTPRELDAVVRACGTLAQTLGAALLPAPAITRVPRSRRRSPRRGRTSARPSTS